MNILQQLFLKLVNLLYLQLKIHSQISYATVFCYQHLHIHLGLQALNLKLLMELFMEALNATYRILLYIFHYYQDF